MAHKLNVINFFFAVNAKNDSENAEKMWKSGENAKKVLLKCFENFENFEKSLHRDDFCLWIKDIDWFNAKK